MKSRLTIVIILALVTKIILLFVVNDDLNMNNDEERNYQIALNHQDGNGYTIYNPESASYVQTAFHSSFSVFIYEFLIKYGINKEAWALFIHVLFIILFAVSISYFYKMSLLFFKSTQYAILSTITYSFYPSTLFYIGTLFYYENLALFLLVIIVFRLLWALKNGFTKTDYLLIPFAVAISCLLRPHAIFIYFVIFSVYSLFILKYHSYSQLPLFLLTISLTVLLHIPILIKNNKMFGEYILSTQSGFVLLHGHNPTARGSWMGNSEDPENPLYKYAHSQIKNISELNELEESRARQQVALKWIRENPLGEIKLALRKIAIYFWPNNFEGLYGSNFINPVNLFTHLFFLCFIVWRLSRGPVSPSELLILSPVAASLILTVISFVGYRWRYYAEPFMIILAWQFIRESINKINIRNLSADPTERKKSG